MTSKPRKTSGEVKERQLGVYAEEIKQLFKKDGSCSRRVTGIAALSA